MSASSRARHALLAAVAFAVSTSSATAQTVPGGVSPLAIEREPPVATKPVFAPPTLIPPAVPGAPVGVSGPPVPPQPIHVPPGPGPVAVPVPAPSPVTIQPVVPPTISSSTAPAIPAPASQPVSPSAPSTAPAAIPAPMPAPTADRPASDTPVPTVAEPSSAAPATTPAPTPAPGPAPAIQVPQGAAPAAEAPAPGEQSAPAAKAKLVVEDVRLEVRPAIFVTGTTSWEKAETLFDKVFKDLGDAVTKTGVTPTSGPIVEYVETDDDSIGYRVMVPIAAAPKGKLPKGIKVGETRGGKALLFRNEGPLEDLEEVYARIDDELAKRSLDNAVIVEAYDEDALASPEDRSILNIWVLIR